MNKTAEQLSEPSLFLEFARYFDLRLALTREERAQVFQVRYRVYCEEFGYEPTEVFRDEQERDVYDDQSAHCLVIHKESGMPAGCVRLVTVLGEQPLPMEEHAGDSIDREFLRSLSGQRHDVCEISRLAVDGAFRRRRGESETRFGTPDALVFTDREKRTFPLLAVSLFVAAAACADLLQRHHLFAIMEPFLPAILRRTGARFERIGQDFEFRGIRAPYYAELLSLRQHAPAELGLAYDFLRETLQQQLTAAQGGLSGAGTDHVLPAAVELFDRGPHLSSVL